MVRFVSVRPQRRYLTIDLSSAVRFFKGAFPRYWLHRDKDLPACYYRRYIYWNKRGYHIKSMVVK